MEGSLLMSSVTRKGHLRLRTLFADPVPQESFQTLMAFFARIDSRESGDSRESEIRVIRANRPDALQK